MFLSAFIYLLGFIYLFPERMRQKGRTPAGSLPPQVTGAHVLSVCRKTLGRDTATFLCGLASRGVGPHCLTGPAAWLLALCL